MIAAGTHATESVIPVGACRRVPTIGSQPAPVLYDPAMSKGETIGGQERAWEDEAENWVRWARTPGHDVFPYFSAAFFAEILPPPGRLTLEIGCGEGRMVRELAARGHRVVGLDASRRLVRAARDVDMTSTYVCGDGTRLPFADGVFDTVVAYNSLQTMAAIGDMAAAVREAGRVMRPAGSFCVCVAHPMTDMALVNQAAGGDIAITGSYFEHQRVDGTVRKEGLSMRFSGWTYTLEDYTRALEDAGFAIDRVREPRPRVEDVAERASLVRWERIPLFLMLRAVKLAS